MMLTGVETDLNVVETSNCKVCSATGDPCECEQTFTMGTGRVIVHNVLGTCVLCGEGDPGGPGEEEEDDPEEGDKCGAEIGQALRTTVGNFYALPDTTSIPTAMALCGALSNPLGKAVGIDFLELLGGSPGDRAGCLTGKCGETVQVDSQCHPYWAVNYIGTGIGLHLCDLPPISSITVFSYCMAAHRGDIQGCLSAVKWFEAGFNGWPTSSTPQDRMPECGFCRENIGPTAFQIRWQGLGGTLFVDASGNASWSWWSVHAQDFIRRSVRIPRVFRGATRLR